MEWDRKNVPTLALLLTLIGMLIGATAYTVGSIHGLENRLSARMSAVEKDVAIIKTMLILQGALPQNLAAAASASFSTPEKD